MRDSKVTVLPIRRLENGQELEEILERIPSVFGQIVCLAKGLPFVSKTAKKVPASFIRKLHGRLFRRWVEMQLADKEADLLPYLATITADIASLKCRKVMLNLCRDVVPADATAAEMQLFLGSVETVLRSLALFAPLLRR
jgi:hypothetical protein